MPDLTELRERLHAYRVKGGELAKKVQAHYQGINKLKSEIDKIKGACEYIESEIEGLGAGESTDEAKEA